MRASRKFRRFYCAECLKLCQIDDGNFYDTDKKGTYDFVCTDCMIGIFKESGEE